MKSLGKFLEGSIYFWVLLEKGVVEFQIYFFGGKQPWEKGVWRVFFFGRGQALEKGIHRFEIALGLFFEEFL